MFTTKLVYTGGIAGEVRDIYHHRLLIANHLTTQVY